MLGWVLRHFGANKRSLGLLAERLHRRLGALRRTNKHMDPNACVSRISRDPLPPYSNNPGRLTSFKYCFKFASRGVFGLALALLPGVSRAQDLQYAYSQAQSDYPTDQTYSPSEAQGAIQPLSAGQLEQLVAPIALYPDALVAQILGASTYPQQVSDADQWRHQFGNAPPEQVVAEADAQPWDPSVKALTAFPQVLERMDRNIQWTTDLGNAYYNQPEDVLEAVQVMRRRAQAAGSLRSTPQVAVRYNADYIELAPVNPQVVYVPAYNPWMVYGEPVAPYPGFSLLGVLGDVFGAPLQYGLGVAISAFTSAPWGWIAWGLDWLAHTVLFDHSDYCSYSHSVSDWGFRHTGFHAYAGHGGWHSGFGRGGMRGEGWRRGGYGRGSWNAFSRGNGFAGNRAGWHSFERRNTFAGNNWRRGSEGFQNFRGARNAGSFGGNYGRGFGNRGENGRATYAANFSRGMNRNFRESSYGNSHFGKNAGSRWGSYSGSSRGWSGNQGHSRMSMFGGGHSQKSFSAKNWGGGGGFRSGGGHAPKFGGGRSFGGGHSGGGHFGGGHSGGHGGGSRHHR